MHTTESKTCKTSCGNWGGIGNTGTVICLKKAGEGHVCQCPRRGMFLAEKGDSLSGNSLLHGGNMKTLSSMTLLLALMSAAGISLAQTSTPSIPGASSRTMGSGSSVEPNTTQSSGTGGSTSSSTTTGGTSGSGASQGQSAGGAPASGITAPTAPGKRADCPEPSAGGMNAANGMRSAGIAASASASGSSSAADCHGRGSSGSSGITSNAAGIGTPTGPTTQGTGRMGSGSPAGPGQSGPTNGIGR